MWRLFLPLALLCVLVACGDGEERFPDESCVFRFTPPSPSLFSAPAPVMTLEEARDRVDYDIKVPAELPDGVKLLGVTVYESDLCPTWANPPIELYYEGPGYTILLRERLSKSNIGDSGATAIEISGVEGEASRGEAGEYGSYMTVAWHQDGIGFSATGFLNDTLTEERFLAILESIE